MDRARHSGQSPRGLRALAAAAALALVATTLLGSSAVAAGRTYTGCIYETGNLTQVAVGTLPYGGVCDGVPRVSWNERGAKGETGSKGEKGKRGKQGKPGKQGEPGATGPEGVPGEDLTFSTYSLTESVSGADQRLLQVAAMCDAGDLATGGGFETEGIILASLGIGADAPTGWQAIAQANPELTELAAFVICADLGTPHQEPAP